MANLSNDQKAELETIINSLIVSSRFQENAFETKDWEGFDLYLKDYYKYVVELDDKFGVKLPALDIAKNYKANF